MNNISNILLVTYIQTDQILHHRDNIESASCWSCFAPSDSLSFPHHINSLGSHKIFFDTMRRLWKLRIVLVNNLGILLWLSGHVILVGSILCHVSCGQSDSIGRIESKRLSTRRRCFFGGTTTVVLNRNKREAVGWSKSRWFRCLGKLIGGFGNKRTGSGGVDHVRWCVWGCICDARLAIKEKMRERYRACENSCLFCVVAIGDAGRCTLLKLHFVLSYGTSDVAITCREAQLPFI